MEITLRRMHSGYAMTTALYPFQRDGVDWLISRGKKHSLIGDEMGLGKSVQAASYLAADEKNVPAIIVCPASLKINWQREIEKWTPYEALILSGNEPYEITRSQLEKTQVIIINYDILGREKKHGKLKTVTGWVTALAELPIATIIADEVQYIASPDAHRTKCFRWLCLSSPNARRIFLSGTPYTTRTSQFFTALNLLDSETFRKRWDFYMRYCDAKKTYWGWTYDGLSNADELNAKVSRVMLRRLKVDVLKDLPPKQKIVVPLETNASDMALYARELADIRATAKIRAISETQKGVCFAKLKRLAYHAKKRAAIAWIKDYLAVENKLVVFVYHHDAFEELMREFEKIAVGLNGETPQAKRTEAVDKFQTDENIKLFIGQVEAAGVGLTLTAAHATAFVEFGATAVACAQAEDRVHRISQSAESVEAYYLIAPNTVEERIADTIVSRNANQKRVWDGVESDDFFDGALAAYK